MNAIKNTSTQEFQSLFRAIDGMKELAVEIETRLCAIPALSPDSGGSGELKKCLFLEKILIENGITNLERIDIKDERADGAVRPNLIAELPTDKEEKKHDAGSLKKTLWIISHLDVVPPGDISLWQTNPWEAVVKDGKIFGRGTEDNQQGLCSAVLAALAFKQCKINPARRLKLLFIADEECGNTYGMEALLKKDELRTKQGAAARFNRKDWALVPDGGDSTGSTIEIAEKNIIWLKINCSGLQSHGSRPDLGSNAMLAGAAAALELHQKLSQRFSERNELFSPSYSTFEPTKKDANIQNINTIPGEDVFYMDMRVLPLYTVEEVLSETDAVLVNLEKIYNVKFKCTVMQQTQSYATAADSDLVKTLGGALKQVLGVEPRPIGIGGGTAAAFLRNIGMDAVVWSKLDDTAHNPNEYAVIDNILDGAKVIALLALSEAMGCDA